jgi:hypothetical protein
MLRHSVLWILRDPLDAESRLAMLQRLAHLGTEPPMVRSGDYGADLFGGTEPLHRVPPWERPPLWRRNSGEGPASNFDLALHLDFEDWDAFRAYAADPTHEAASNSNKVTSFDEFTARVDWYYEGDVPPTRQGHVKHAAMFVWKEEASEGERAAAIAGVESLTGRTELSGRWSVTMSARSPPTTTGSWTSSCRIRTPPGAFSTDAPTEKR